MATDPVCGMRVEEATACREALENGREEFIC